MDHVFQHIDEPTWCIHCGRFKEHATGPCLVAAHGQYDNRVEENRLRLIRSIFCEAQEVHYSE